MQMTRQRLPDTLATGIPTVDPDVEKHLEVSIDNLEKVFREHLRLRLFSVAVKEKGLLADPTTSGRLFTALDSVAFHLGSVDDDPKYHYQYLRLFKTVPQPSGLTNWFKAIEVINKDIEESLTKDKTEDALNQFQKDKEAYFENLENRRSHPPTAVDPDAEAFLEISINNLNGISGEPTRLGLFSIAVKEKRLLANPARTDDPILGVLDEVAFHLKYVDDDPNYHDQYFGLLKKVPQPSGVTDWLDEIQEINKGIERSVAKDEDAVRKFQNEKKAYLTDLAVRRRELLEARGPSQGIDLKFLGGEIGRKAEGVNIDARVPSGGINPFVGYTEGGDDLSEIGTGNKLRHRAGWTSGWL